VFADVECKLMAYYLVKGSATRLHITRLGLCLNAGRKGRLKRTSWFESRWFVGNLIISRME